MSKFNPHSPELKKIVRGLRPPSAVDLRLVNPFSLDTPPNTGHTYEIASGESVVSPGDGVIKSIELLYAAWNNTDSALDTVLTYAVVIDHGYGAESLVHGIQTIEGGLNIGNTVVRGDALGTPLATEIFYQFNYNSSLYDPTTLNRHFPILADSRSPGKGGYVRKSPDRVQRSFLTTITTAIVSGIRTFCNTGGAAQLLVNVDFNGDETMEGVAATGLTPEDYWNVFQAASFTGGIEVYDTPCNFEGNPIIYDSAPVVLLRDSENLRSQVQFWKTSMTVNSGTSAEFSPVLSTYVGGSLVPTTRTNSFELKNISAGSYELYLYANQGDPGFTSTFQVGINGGTPENKTVITTVDAAYVENENFVKYTLTVPEGGYISIVALGYLCGLQLFRP